MQELLDDRQGGLLTDYVSMSVTHLGEYVVISLTTTGSEPVTYSAVVSSTESIDPESLVFIPQRDGGGIQPCTFSS